MEIAAFTILAIVLMVAISILCLLHHLEQPNVKTARRIKARRAAHKARRAERKARR